MHLKVVAATAFQQGSLEDGWVKEEKILVCEMKKIEKIVNQVFFKNLLLI